MHTCDRWHMHPRVPGSTFALCLLPFAWHGLDDVGVACSAQQARSSQPGHAGGIQACAIMVPAHVLSTMLTRVGDGQYTDAEVLAAGSAQVHVVCAVKASEFQWCSCACESMHHPSRQAHSSYNASHVCAHAPLTAAVVVHARFGEHGVVLDLRLPHGRAIVAHNNQLGYST